MKTGEALQIGGGNIGRALVGEVMREAGLHVTFADVLANLPDDEWRALVKSVLSFPNCCRVSLG